MNNKYSEAEIVADIERHIVENGIAPGVKLSSAVQYALRYGVSAKTADRALNRLQKRGIIERRRGSGNFVKKNRHPSNRINVCFIWWHVPGIASLDFYPGNIFWQTLCQLMDEHQITYNIFFESPAQLEQPVNRLHKYDLMVAPAGLVMHKPDTFRNCRVLTRRSSITNIRRSWNPQRKPVSVRRISGYGWFRISRRTRSIRR